MYLIIIRDKGEAQMALTCIASGEIWNQWLNPLVVYGFQIYVRVSNIKVLRLKFC